MRILLYRHGATEGTVARRYEGAGTDVALSEAGRAALSMLPVDECVSTVYTSGMLRCAQTAQILFPHARQIAVPGLREMDFGSFEGKAFADLADDGAYRQWVEGGCWGVCPGGEDRSGFTRRCVGAFSDLVDDLGRAGAEQVVIVAHAGTARAIISSLAVPAMEYFSIETPPGGCWELEGDGRRLEVICPPSQEGCSGGRGCA
ncbi:histidine phosphatase family protein [Collinsella sp. An2]|uniref:histidine phosphatase family protein n=1 Tax=Collinsella sp. An2 TaxID=1965585 RepID=UPI0013023CBC|nr:histidine phosphatase family protein [Collinsella sp. An2]